jgi:hypothetical protein
VRVRSRTGGMCVRVMTRTEGSAVRVMTRTETLSVRVIRMLPQPVGLFSVERAFIKLDVFF